MRLTVFASGSTGNCALAEAGDARILIDDGISLRRLRGFLAAMGLGPDSLDGVFITHEHRDHVSGLAALCKCRPLPVYALRPVAARLAGMLPETEGLLRPIQPGGCVDIASARLTPFETSHDTPASAGCRIDCAEGALGVCTDLGVVTDAVREALAGVKCALIEANHDVGMLLDGPYPAALKRRVLSERGHLSNEASAELAVCLAENGAETIILGHLSRENNSPGRALSAVGGALARAGYDIKLMAAPPLGALSAVYLEKCPA